MKILQGIRRVHGSFYRKCRQKRKYAYMETHGRVITGTAAFREEKVYPMQGRQDAPVIYTPKIKEKE